MSYLGIDRKRYGYLLSHATKPHEIDRFFKERKQSLILKGAKVQNLPVDPLEKLKYMVSRFPPACDEVVRSWFAEHLEIDAPDDAVVVRAIYEYMERTGQSLNDELTLRTARSCLHHLFSEEPPEILLTFLRSPIVSDTPAVVVASPVAPIEEKTPPMDPGFLAQLCQSLIAGDPPLGELERVPAELVEFTAGMSAYRRGDKEEFDRAIATLAPHRNLVERLRAFEAGEEKRRAIRADDVAGLRLLAGQRYSGGFDIARDQVLARCTRADQPNTVFLRPFGVLIEGHLHLLDDTARQALFPSSGDLIAFSGPRHPTQPRAGALGACKAEEIYSDKKEINTRFRIASELSPSWKVVTIPASSTDYDAVREHIVTYGEHVPEPHRVLFALADGILVGHRGNLVDYSRPELFENDLCLWNSLEAISFAGQSYVLGPLPKEHGTYECARIETVVRKHLRSLIGVENTPVRVTKAQIHDIVLSLPESTIQREERDMQRIHAALTRLGEHWELLELFVKEVCAQKDIRDEVARWVEAEGTRLLGEKKHAQEEIDRLRAEAAELDARLRKERAQQKRLPEEVSKSVRAAFERASANGIAALGEIPLWQALLSKSTAPAATTDPNPSCSLPRPQVHVLDRSGNDLTAFLKSLGLSRRSAETLLGAGEAVFDAGLILCAKGTAARIALREWARTLGSTAIAFDANVGLIDDADMRSVLAHNPETLVLLDANLSALELYARALLDQVMGRIVSSQSGANPRVLCALSDSVAALPLGNRATSISITVNLDQRYPVLRPDEVTDRLADLADPEGEDRAGGLWAPAYERLLGQVSLLDDERKGLALPLLFPKH